MHVVIRHSVMRRPGWHNQGLILSYQFPATCSASDGVHVKSVNFDNLINTLLMGCYANPIRLGEVLIGM